MKTKLTIEQSQRLIELGVDPSKASEVKEFDDELSQWTHRGSPIFTLTDILSLLPTEIMIHRNGDTLGMIYHCGQWRAGYSHEAIYCDHTKVAPELIDALFELLVWVLQNHPDKIKKL